MSLGWQTIANVLPVEALGLVSTSIQHYNKLEHSQQNGL